MAEENSHEIDQSPRTQNFDILLSNEIIDQKTLRRLAFDGVPDELRATIWKLLLFYLPVQTGKWESHLQSQRNAYRRFINEIIPLPKFGDSDIDEMLAIERCKVKEEGFVQLFDSDDEDLTPAHLRTTKNRQLFQNSEDIESPGKLVRNTKFQHLFGDDDKQLTSCENVSTENISRRQSYLFDDEESDEMADQQSDKMNNSKEARKKLLFGEPESKAFTQNQEQTLNVQTKPHRQSMSSSQTSRKSITPKYTTVAGHGTQFIPGPVRQRTISSDFDPLSNDPSNSWNAYFQDADLRAEISKDVCRTHPTLQFFQKKSVQHILSRILFLYAKLNPGVAYVQGMNEIVSPLLYVIANEKNISLEDAEADTFYTFTAVMAETRDVFIRDNDETDEGIHGVMRLFDSILKEHDPELHEHLTKLGVVPEVYAFRWLTTLLAREFTLADTIFLWDKFFADAQRFRFAIYSCVAIAMLQRNILLSCDFAEAMQVLQQNPEVDLKKLTGLAQKIRQAERTIQQSSPSNQTPYITEAVKAVTGEQQNAGIARTRTNSTQQDIFETARKAASKMGKAFEAAFTAKRLTNSSVHELKPVQANSGRANTLEAHSPHVSEPNSSGGGKPHSIHPVTEESINSSEDVNQVDSALQEVKL